jgi:hypothetical protein
MKRQKRRLLGFKFHFLYDDVVEFQSSEGFVRQIQFVFRYSFCAVIVFFLTAVEFPAHAADRYTDQQLDALASRVGKIYWIVAINNETPPFLSSPANNAASFHPQPNESFVITELVGRKDKNPFYKVKFDSGKEGYIQPEVFLEELNASIAAFDPKAGANKKAAEAAEEEKKRVDWIQSQPWSRAVKEAAIKRQVLGGMNEGEVRKILGNPIRVSKVKGRLNFTEERWLYADGSTFVFVNGLLSRIEPKPNNNP